MLTGRSILACSYREERWLGLQFNGGLEHIPAPTFNFTALQRSFASKGLNVTDLVILSSNLKEKKNSEFPYDSKWHIRMIKIICKKNENKREFILFDELYLHQYNIEFEFFKPSQNSLMKWWYYFHVQN